MAAERRLRLLNLIVDHGAELDAARLCEVSVAVTGCTGAVVMIMSDDLPRGSACATDDVAASIEELQFSLGEGPCIDAFRHGVPVLEPDLDASRVARWQAFTGPALVAGARAVFAFPLRTGGVHLGALCLHRASAGPLSDEQHADALAMAEIVTRFVLLAQSGAPPGQLAAELGDDTTFHYVVHQASGMIAAQLEVSIAVALLTLRAHAFGNGVPLAELAGDVVARRLGFGALGLES